MAWGLSPGLSDTARAWQGAGAAPSSTDVTSTTGANPDPRLTGFLLDPKYHENPKFDHRMQNTGHMIGKMPRGRISLARRESVGLGSEPPCIRSCNFLFNPTQITQSYAFTDQTPLNPDPNDKSVPTISGQTVRFQLYFDRTFELAYRGASGGQGGPAAELGVLADVGAFENIARANFGRAPSAVPVIVSFGANWLGAPWSFYGWISQFDVVYSHFNVRMIPQRAAIDISLTRIYSSDAPGAGAPSSGGGGGSGSGSATVNAPGSTAPGWN